MQHNKHRRAMRLWLPVSNIKTCLSDSWKQMPLNLLNEITSAVSTSKSVSNFCSLGNRVENAMGWRIQNVMNLMNRLMGCFRPS